MAGCENPVKWVDNAVVFLYNTEIARFPLPVYPFIGNDVLTQAYLRNCESAEQLRICSEKWCGLRFIIVFFGLWESFSAPHPK